MPGPEAESIRKFIVPDTEKELVREFLRDYNQFKKNFVQSNERYAQDYLDPYRQLAKDALSKMGIVSLISNSVERLQCEIRQMQQAAEKPTRDNSVVRECQILLFEIRMNILEAKRKVFSEIEKFEKTIEQDNAKIGKIELKAQDGYQLSQTEIKKLEELNQTVQASEKTLEKMRNDYFNGPVEEFIQRVNERLGVHDSQVDDKGLYLLRADLDPELVLSATDLAINQHFATVPTRERADKIQKYIILYNQLRSEKFDPQAVLEQLRSSQFQALLDKKSKEEINALTANDDVKKISDVGIQALRLLGFDDKRDRDRLGETKKRLEQFENDVGMYTNKKLVYSDDVRVFVHEVARDDVRLSQRLSKHGSVFQKDLGGVPPTTLVGLARQAVEIVEKGELNASQADKENPNPQDKKEARQSVKRSASMLRERSRLQRSTRLTQTGDLPKAKVETPVLKRARTFTAKTPSAVPLTPSVTSAPSTSPAQRKPLLERIRTAPQITAAPKTPSVGTENDSSRSQRSDTASSMRGNETERVAQEKTRPLSEPKASVETAQSSTLLSQVKDQDSSARMEPSVVEGSSTSASPVVGESLASVETDSEEKDSAAEMNTSVAAGRLRALMEGVMKFTWARMLIEAVGNVASSIQEKRSEAMSGDNRDFEKLPKKGLGEAEDLGPEEKVWPEGALDSVSEEGLGDADDLGDEAHTLSESELEFDELKTKIGDEKSKGSGKNAAVLSGSASTVGLETVETQSMEEKQGRQRSSTLGGAPVEDVAGESKKSGGLWQTIKDTWANTSFRFGAARGTVEALGAAGNVQEKGVGGVKAEFNQVRLLDFAEKFKTDRVGTKFDEWLKEQKNTLGSYSGDGKSPPIVFSGGQRIEVSGKDVVMRGFTAEMYYDVTNKMFSREELPAYSVSAANTKSYTDIVTAVNSEPTKSLMSRLTSAGLFFQQVWDTAKSWVMGTPSTTTQQISTEGPRRSSIADTQDRGSVVVQSPTEGVSLASKDESKADPHAKQAQGHVSSDRRATYVRTGTSEDVKRDLGERMEMIFDEKPLQQGKDSAARSRVSSVPLEAKGDIPPMVRVQVKVERNYDLQALQESLKTYASENKLPPFRFSKTPNNQISATLSDGQGGKITITVNEVIPTKPGEPIIPVVVLEELKRPEKGPSHMAKLVTALPDTGTVKNVEVSGKVKNLVQTMASEMTTEGHKVEPLLGQGERVSPPLRNSVARPGNG